MLVLIVIIIALFYIASKVPDSGSTSKDDVWNTMGRVKCQCLSCNQTVYIPTQYLERRYGVQNSKCPNCGWKMTKVKIIQTWGID